MQTLFSYLMGLGHKKYVTIKAIGGVWGVFCMLGSYKSAAPYGTSAFYRLLISRSVLKICPIKVRPRTPK